MCNAFITRAWELTPKKILWLYKCEIIPEITYAVVAWWDIIGMSTEGHMHYDHRGNENNSNKSAGDVLGSANTLNGGGVCSTDGSIPPTEARSEKPRNRT